MRALVSLAVSLALPLAVGALAGWVTSSSVQSWYPTLEKPSFNPPAWIFGPAWTVLYVLMGIAAWLVWRTGWGRPEVRFALAVYALQLVLNGIWSLIFFGLRAPGPAFAEIVLLWLAIAATLALFWRVRPLASGLLVPYLAWVSFAVALNFSIWRLNP